MWQQHPRGAATKLALRVGLVLLALTAVAAAQPAQPAKSEMEHLVPPQGGAVDVPVQISTRSRRQTVTVRDGHVRWWPLGAWSSLVAWLGGLQMIGPERGGRLRETLLVSRGR
jgi:hypothetical protein